MLILFFDTYIVAGFGSKGGSNSDLRRANCLAKIRDTFSTYKWQEKIDIVKYTLVSYSKIKWDKVIIRYECEDQKQILSFGIFCKSLFPNAKIFNQRSATAAQYVAAFDEIEDSDESWVFFSPNNDHPFLAQPINLINTLNIADNISKNNPGCNISINYSHFTEAINDNRFLDPQWGYYQGVLKKVIYEDEYLIATKANKTLFDSIRIYKLGFLKKIFFKTKNKGRVIRIEDTEFYISLDRNSITISPKIEFCRHYDSYTHIINFVSPLFIPSGFFENNIKIRYGYEDSKDGCVNINPLKESIDGETDMLVLLEDIPSFWSDRISKIEINPSFPKNLNRKNLLYYKNLNNPWYARSVFYNFIRSCRIYFFAILYEYTVLILKKLSLLNLAKGILKRMGNVN